MYKFFDYLAPDLPIRTIRDLLGYIRRFAALFGAGGVPVEGPGREFAWCMGPDSCTGLGLRWLSGRAAAAYRVPAGSRTRTGLDRPAGCHPAGSGMAAGRDLVGWWTCDAPCD